MNPPRLIPRRLAIATLACILLVGLVFGEQRRSGFRRLRDHHTALAARSAIFRYSGPGGNDYVSRFEQNHRKWQYHAAMTDKYRLAMWLPWLPVAPDRPEPK